MPRYILTEKRAGATEQQKRDAHAQLDAALARVKDAKIIADNRPADPAKQRRVVVLEIGAAEAQQLAATLPESVILDEDAPRQAHRRHHIPPQIDMAAAGVTTPTYHAKVTAGGAPLTGVEVLLYISDVNGQLKMINGEPPTTTTDASGGFSVQLFPGERLLQVQPVPYSGFWITLVGPPPSGGTIDCPALPRSGPFAWWHAAVGVGASATARGSGIKVGVIDTGCGPHPNLAHVELVGVFIGGQELNNERATDVAEHGTHTSGLIGARPSQPGDYSGLAPDCQLYHVRVFADENSGVQSSADIINAIDRLSRDIGCDLINMSLGGKIPNKGEHDAIRRAAERGTLCICSAGNESGPVEYPAAFPESVAVSAIGQDGDAPSGTLSGGRRPNNNPTLIGQSGFFLADFSCYGANLACAGPGVAIISTVPDRGGNIGAYMEMDGTSMASPAVCGALAAIIGADAQYKSLPRDHTRSAKARDLLRQHCRSIGLAGNYQGNGMPHL